MTYPVEIKNLSKTYRGKKGMGVDALMDLSLNIEPGEVFGFLGPNGAGKSTTIKILMGLITTTAGSACLFGKEISNAEARLSVGYLPENPALYDFLTGREYLGFVGNSFGMSEAAVGTRASEVLTQLELSDASKRQIRSYSKGMVQRLGLAQTLLHDPDLYILDEPMSGLDPIGRALVKEIIRDLKQRGKTVFFSTHITADVEAVCDRVGVIVKGKLEALESVENIMRSGIEGYTVQVSSGSMETESGYEFRTLKEGVREYYVPKDSFNRFIESISASGGKVELIETRRKDLEEFFLEIVK